MKSKSLPIRRIAAGSPLRLGCRFEPPLSPEQMEYAQCIGELIGSRVELLPKTVESGSGAGLPDDAENMDLLIYWERERTWWQRWLGWTPASGVVEQARGSVLVPREPRWPLQRFLLILRGHESDEFALSWLGRLVRRRQGEVFVLPIIPPVPAMHRHNSIPIQAEALLAPATFLGAEMRRLIDVCDSCGVPGTLLLHDGRPQRRIEWAAAASNCDLILIGAEPFPWIQRRLFGELERPLLSRADRPVLVARDLQHARLPA